MESIELSAEDGRMLEASLADVRTGNVKEFDDVESLIADLHAETEDEE